MPKVRNSGPRVLLLSADNPSSRKFRPEKKQFITHSGGPHTVTIVGRFLADEAGPDGFRQIELCRRSVADYRAAAHIKGEFRGIEICLVSGTIDINRSIFDVSRNEGLSSEPSKNTVSQVARSQSSGRPRRTGTQLRPTSRPPPPLTFQRLETLSTLQLTGRSTIPWMDWRQKAPATRRLSISGRPAPAAPAPSRGSFHGCPASKARTLILEMVAPSLPARRAHRI